MEQLKKIRNTLDVPQQIIYKGKQEVLAPLAEETFTADLADAFLAKCAPVVQEVEEKHINWAGYEDLKSGQTAWIANVTGDKNRYKEKVKIQTVVVENGHRVNKEVEVDDKRREGYPLRRDWDPGQKVYQGKYGKEGLSYAPVPVELGVRERKAFPKEVVDWFMKRDSQAGSHPHNKTAIRSRAPSNFEPDLEWDLDDIRLYARMISAGQAEEGKAQAQILEKAKKDKLDGAAVVRVVREAKQKLLDTLFYYVADPRYRLPTKAEFMELKHGRSLDEIQADEMAALIAKAEAAVGGQQQAGV